MAALNNSSLPSEIPNIFYQNGACIILSLVLKKYALNPLMVDLCLSKSTLCFFSYLNCGHVI